MALEDNLGFRLDQTLRYAMLVFHFYPDSKTLPFVSAISSLGILAVLYFPTEQLGEMGWEMIAFIQPLEDFLCVPRHLPL